MTTYYVLESGIEIPEIERGRRKPTKSDPLYPFADAAVGQSFLVPHDQGKSVAVIASQRQEKYRDQGVRFTTRVMNDGVRVWRTA